MKRVGVLLCGGKSSRLGQPKEKLKIDGVSLLDKLKSWLEDCCDHVVLSCRREQRLPHRPLHHYDSGIQGPMGGLMVCSAQYPDSMILALACDLPFLKKSTLLQLTHESSSHTRAFYHRDKDLYEPLVALYSPRHHRSFQFQEQYGLNNFLKNNGDEVEKIMIKQAHEFCSINTYEDLRKATSWSQE